MSLATMVNGIDIDLLSSQSLMLPSVCLNREQIKSITSLLI